MRNTSLGASVFFFLCLVVCGGGYDLWQWAFSGKPLSASAATPLLQDAEQQIAQREQQVKTIRVEGHLTRESWDGQQAAWAPAGELVASCTYEDGGFGRARVECSRDTFTAPSVEAEKIDRSFLSVYDGKTGCTLTTSAGGRHELTLETRRPEIMEAPDMATGWRFSFLGRWIGAASDSEIFPEFLDGKRPATTLTVTQNADQTFLTVRATSGALEEMFSIDVGEGYAFDHWEQRDAGSGKTLGKGLGKLHRSMDVSRWWILKPVFYPQNAEYIEYAADGSPLVRNTIHVDSFTMDPKRTEHLTRVDAPGGDVTFRTPDKTVTLSGSAEENDKALQVAWDALEK